MNGYEWKEVDGGLEYRIPHMRARVYCDFSQGWTYEIITEIGYTSVTIKGNGIMSGNDDLRQARRKQAENVMDTLAKLDK